jgi:hypothetical protein
MADYPVMFTVRDTVSGNGFLAGVTLTGRAIMSREEDGKWWVYGVRPAAIAESGETPQEAFMRFRNSYKNVLFDFAEGSDKYENFRESVEAFYHQPDQQEENRWLGAFRALRCGDVKAEPPFFSTLPKEDPDKRPTQIGVERLDKESTRYTSADNVSDYFVMAKAA